MRLGVNQNAGRLQADLRAKLKRLVGDCGRVMEAEKE